MSAEKLELEKNGFEKVFQLVGGRGKFQWTLAGILSLQLIILTWNHLGYIFIGAVPQHWCKIDELAKVDWDNEKIKDLSIPKIINSQNPDDWKYDSCSYYDYDYNEIVVKFGSNFSAAFEHAQTVHKKNDVIKKACTKWEYDDSIYSSTIVTEFNLVCDRRPLVGTIQSTYMIGGLFGTVLFGGLNDRILGRRKTALISIILVLIGGFAASFSKSYWMFVFLRLFIAMGTAGCMSSSSLLILEHCDLKSRAKLYSIVGGFFGVGYGIMPIFAYFIRDWAMLQFAFSGTTLILLSYFWVFPESPRWLASMGRDEEAIKALEHMAKVNCKPKPDKLQLLSGIQASHKHKPEDGKLKPNLLRKLQSIFQNVKSLVDTREGLKRTITVWILFIVVAFVYYGFAFSTNLTSNPYLLVAFGGLMEVPACIAPIPFLSYWGRRPTTAICYFFTGLCALAIVITPPEYETARVIFTMGGKFFIAAAFNVIYLVVSEIYPTAVRSTGQSLGTLMGRFGSIAAPYVADLLTTLYPDLPCLIFGIASIAGSGVALLLPEMKNMEMMDQVSELELEKL